MPPHPLLLSAVLVPAAQAAAYCVQIFCSRWRMTPTPRPSSSLLCRCSFLVVTHFTAFDKSHMAVNALVLGVLIVAKIPEMHGVRIFKINKAPTDTD